MKRAIRLASIDKSNWESVVELELEKAQENFVASNAYSLAEAAYDSDCAPLAIYADDEIVGFVMYASLASEGQAGTYMICRLMVDRAHQKKGYGRQALELTIAHISSKPGSRTIKICYHPQNPVAKDFYASFGFVEAGLDEEGEMIAEMPALQGVSPDIP